MKLSSPQAAATGSSPRISARGAANSAAASRSVPVGHRMREQALHRRRVVVGKVGVGFVWSNRASADQGQ
jgi:hypothetical protein